MTVPADAPLSRLDWLWAWVIVFFANLPIPLVFARSAVGDAGMHGVIGGLLVLFWIGFALCLFRFRVGRSLVIGGAAVALWQVCPVFHYVAGVTAVFVWGWVRGSGVTTGSADNIDGFAIVMLASPPLWALAVLLGTAYRWAKRDTPLWSNRTEPDAEPATEENDE